MEKLNFSNMDEEKLADLVDPWINENINELVGENHQRFYRCPKTVVDYTSTTWGRWLRNPQIWDPNSKIAKVFLQKRLELIKIPPYRDPKTWDYARWLVLLSIFYPAFTSQ